MIWPQGFKQHDSPDIFSLSDCKLVHCHEHAHDHYINKFQVVTEPIYVLQVGTLLTWTSGTQHKRQTITTSKQLEGLLMRWAFGKFELVVVVDIIHFSREIQTSRAALFSSVPYQPLTQLSDYSAIKFVWIHMQHWFNFEIESFQWVHTGPGDPNLQILRSRTVVPKPERQCTRPAVIFMNAAQTKIENLKGISKSISCVFGGMPTHLMPCVFVCTVLVSSGSWNMWEDKYMHSKSPPMIVSQASPAKSNRAHVSWAFSSRQNILHVNVKWGLRCIG